MKSSGCESVMPRGSVVVLGDGHTILVTDVEGERIIVRPPEYVVGCSVCSWKNRGFGGDWHGFMDLAAHQLESPGCVES